MKIWGYMIAGALLLAGGTSTYRVMKNPNPITISFEEFNSNILNNVGNPDWVQLTECNLDLTDAVYFESKLLKTKEVSEIFVPIKATSGVDSIRHTALLSIKNKESLAKFNELLNIEDDSKMLEFLNENYSTLIRENVQINGVVRSWMDRDDKDNKKLREAYPTLRSGFVIVEEGNSPSKKSILLIPVAFVLLYFLLKKKKPEQV